MSSGRPQAADSAPGTTAARGSSRAATARCIATPERTFRRSAGEDDTIDPNPAQASGGDLEAAIAALWDEARPRTLGRIETIEAAIASLRAGTLDAATAEHARREAHKLAGALGTFGLVQGTDQIGRAHV